MRRFGTVFYVLLLGLVAACGSSRHRYAPVDPAEVSREDVLVVGRLRLFYDGEDVTDRATLHTSPEGTYRLGPNGHLSWLTSRPVEAMHFDGLGIEDDDSGVVELGEHRLLFIPPDIDVRMFYVGDIVVALGDPPDRDLGVELNKRNRMLHIGRGDHADRVLRRIAAGNEHVAGAQYYNVVRGARAQAPQR